MTLRLVQRTAIYSAAVSFSVCAALVLAAAFAFEWQEETILNGALRAGVEEMRANRDGTFEARKAIHDGVVAALSRNGNLTTVPESLRELTPGSHEIVDGPFAEYRVLIQQFGADRYYYGVSMAEAEAREQHYAKLSLSLLVLAGLICGLMGWLFAQTLVRPMRLLADEINRLEDRDLSVTIALKTQDEIDEIASAVNRYRDRLRAAAENQTRFLADVSHALRTPAAVIQSGLEVLEQRAVEIPGSRELERFQTVLARTHEHAVQLSLKVDALMLSAQGSNEDNVELNVVEQIELALRFARIRDITPVSIDVPPTLVFPLRGAVFRWLIVQCVNAAAACELIEIRWQDRAQIDFWAVDPKAGATGNVFGELNSLCQIVAEREGWRLMGIEANRLRLVLAQA